MSDEHLEGDVLHPKHEEPERHEPVGAPEAKAEDQSLQPKPPEPIPVPEAEKPERPVEAAFPFAPPPPPAPKPTPVLEDAEVIGGMSVLVGSDLYDGTVLRRLTEARHALAT